MLHSVTVFTGSASGVNPRFAEAVKRFADAASAAGVSGVYGGGHVGLMGVFADAMLAAGAEVRGVMPKGLVDREIAHPRLTSLDVVADMHERKQRMAELGDGFVALPGGVGTLEELFEAWTWQHLGIHAKPVALFDVDGFWQPLVHMLDSMTDAGFIAAPFREALIVESNPEVLLEAMSAWQPLPPKWS